MDGGVKFYLFCSVEDDSKGTDRESSEPPRKRSKFLGNVDLNDPDVQKLLKAKSKHKGALAEVRCYNLHLIKNHVTKSFFHLGLNSINKSAHLFYIRCHCDKKNKMLILLIKVLFFCSSVH